jgi:cob(I)alamin adenosyltransferase
MMPRLTKITTKKGDDGTTSLGSGQRVPKDSLRVKAYGSVDELASHIGLALAHGLSGHLVELLPGIHNELFHLGADLSFREEDKEKYKLPMVEERHVARLTEMAEELNEQVGPLKNFILPGGCVGAAQLHVARTICRRAERDVVALAREEAIGPYVIRYLNRLSDLLFLMARYENQEKGVAEPLWDSLT